VPRFPHASAAGSDLAGIQIGPSPESNRTGTPRQGNPRALLRSPPGHTGSVLRPRVRSA
jgi:hypothetical protein